MTLRCKITRCCLVIGVTVLTLSCWSADAQVSTYFWDLGEVLFVDSDPDRDRDADGLKDDLEYKLADTFKPFLIFDSAEASRLPDEPVALFQVRPRGCIGKGCPPAAGGFNHWTIVIIYAFLFQRDGGYGPSSSCRNDHNGDNEGATVELVTQDGRYMTVSRVLTGAWESPPRGWFLPWAKFEGTHPIVFMSAHKHHQYFDTSRDEQDSVYSSWGCNDDVDGKGTLVLPPLRGEVCRDLGIRGGVHKIGCRDMPYNVGEPENHDPVFFVNDLSGFGYKGEDAWSPKPFKGGLGDDGGDTSSVLSMWSIETFQLGSEFNAYLPERFYLIVNEDLLLLY